MAKGKVESVMRVLGKRNCVAYSMEKDKYYSKNGWVDFMPEATILSFQEIFDLTKELPLSLKLDYLLVKV